MKGGCDEVLLVRRPIAVQELSNGSGIEILQIGDGKVEWSEKRTRTSKVDETGEAFRTGRVWRRLSGFEKVR